MSATLTVAGFVTKNKTTLDLAALRSPRRIKSVYVEVLEAFNAAGNDTLTVGYASDPDAYATSIDVSTTGVKSVSLGTGINYDTVERLMQAFYSASSGTPTTGSALIIVEYDNVPFSPV